MFRYKKSNAKHGNIKIPDFQIAVNSISEEKVYLWTNDITLWAHLFLGRLMLIFSKKSTSITDYINFYDSDSSLPTLIKLFYTYKTILSVYPDSTDLHENIPSSLTTLVSKDALGTRLTLAKLILNTRYTFFTDYADFRDYIQHIKNNFTNDYANYADF